MLDAEQRVVGVARRLAREHDGQRRVAARASESLDGIVRERARQHDHLLVGSRGGAAGQDGAGERVDGEAVVRRRARVLRVHHLAAPEAHVLIGQLVARRRAAVQDQAQRLLHRAHLGQQALLLVHRQPRVVAVRVARVGDQQVVVQARVADAHERCHGGRQRDGVVVRAPVGVRAQPRRDLGRREAGKVRYGARCPQEAREGLGPVAHERHQDVARRRQHDGRGVGGAVAQLDGHGAPLLGLGAPAALGRVDRVLQAQRHARVHDGAHDAERQVAQVVLDVRLRQLALARLGVGAHEPQLLHHHARGARSVGGVVLGRVDIGQEIGIAAVRGAKLDPQGAIKHDIGEAVGAKLGPRRGDVPPRLGARLRESPQVFQQGVRVKVVHVDRLGGSGIHGDRCAERGWMSIIQFTAPL